MSLKEKENYLTCDTQLIKIIWWWNSKTQWEMGCLGGWDQELFVDSETEFLCPLEEHVALQPPSLIQKQKDTEIYKQLWNRGSQNVGVTLTGDKNTW